MPQATDVEVQVLSLIVVIDGRKPPQISVGMREDMDVLFARLQLEQLCVLGLGIVHVSEDVRVEYLSDAV